MCLCEKSLWPDKDLKQMRVFYPRTWLHMCIYSQLSVCTELELHPQNHNVGWDQVSAVPVEVTVMITAWQLWSIHGARGGFGRAAGAWASSERLQSALHNRDEILMSKHAHAEHQLCCKELLMALLLKLAVSQSEKLGFIALQELLKQAQKHVV